MLQLTDTPFLRISGLSEFEKIFDILIILALMCPLQNQQESDLWMRPAHFMHVLFRSGWVMVQ